MAVADVLKSSASRQATMEATAKEEFAELSEQYVASEPRFNKSVDEQDWMETVAVGSKYSKVEEEQRVSVYRSQSDACGCAASCKNRDMAGRTSLTKTCISPNIPHILLCKLHALLNHMPRRECHEHL